MYPILSLPIQYAKLRFIAHHIITPWREAFGIELIMLWLSFQDYFCKAKIFKQKKMIEKKKKKRRRRSAPIGGRSWSMPRRGLGQRVKQRDCYFVDYKGLNLLI